MSTPVTRGHHPCWRREDVNLVSAWLLNHYNTTNDASNRSQNKFGKHRSAEKHLTDQEKTTMFGYPEKLMPLDYPVKLQVLIHDSLN